MDTSTLHTPPHAALARRHFLGAALFGLPLAASAGYNFWTGEYTMTLQEIQAHI